LYVPREFFARVRPEPSQAPRPRPDSPARRDESKAPPLSVAAPGSVADDRTAIQPGDRVLLIVEDDDTFARTLLAMARERGFRGIVASNGTSALDLARTLKPDAITLDLRLPDMDGWVVLDQLKHDAETRHIPVHVISALEDERRGLEQGAIAFLTKPAEREAVDRALDTIEAFLERRIKHVLVVEDDSAQRRAIVELIGDEDVQTIAVDSGEAALKALETQAFDCMVIDLRLPGMPGLELMKKVKEKPALRRLPIIVYTGKDLSKQEETELRQIAETIIVKDVRSPERLLDETALFLHRVQENLPPPKREMLRRLSQVDPALVGRKVLIVDDDVRNIFALTALLEQHQMQVLYAENGRDALSKLEQEPTVELVLMDIMMPEMDGYEALQHIRSHAQWTKLPVIALTAKAMKGDREKCIEAGASDYITKPVDPDQLLSLLRVWLYR
jgi:hypothetical protein